jgi:chemotaxis-related protein WspD
MTAVRHLPVHEPEAHCWTTIGVFSDAAPSCPRLAEAIHCQNCEVYSAAGRALFERAAPRGYADEWTRALRADKQREQIDTTSILVFRIGSEWLGLPTAALSQVSDLRRIHSLPHRSDAVLLGLVNVRGRIQVCCSLAALLGIAQGAEPDAPAGSLAYRRMIVAASERDRWVLPVDEIDGVRRFRPRHVRDLPVTVARDRAHFTRFVVEFDDAVLLHSERGRAALPFGSRQIGCLDAERVFEALRQRVLRGAAPVAPVGG